MLPVAKIYSLADILASCINSAPSTACNALFNAAAPSSGTTPGDTISAALDISQNPAHNVATLFALATPEAPFQPSLSAAPTDWTLAITFTGGGLDIPASIAVDASGNVWTSNVCSSNTSCSSATKLSPTGQPLSPAPNGYTDGTLFESYGLALDLSGNVWVTNQQSASSVNSRDGSVAELASSGQVSSTFSGGGVFFPIAIAADADGSVWIANQGDSSATKLASNGSPIAGPVGTGSLSGPSAVAIDANHNAWFANQQDSSGTVTSISSNGNIANKVSSGGYEPSGIAIDQIGISTNASKGHVWIANYFTSSVSELLLNNDGSVTVVSNGYTNGGINHPNGIAVDGSGNVWLTDFDGNALSELEGANGSHPGQAISPASGFGTDANLSLPYGIALDSSGNIWISNSGSNSITQFLGLATPVKTPLVGPPQLP
jgi:streptogramin lyase